MWKEIVKLAESIKWADKKARIHAIGSAYYGLYLYEIYRSLMYLDDAKKRGDRESIINGIKAYDKAWLIYNKLPQQYPQLATLYTQKYNRNRKSAHSKVEVLRSKFISSDK